MSENDAVHTADTARADWESRLAAVWALTSELDDAELVRRIDALADEWPADDPAALYERASARDTAGIEDEAEGFYRQALASGRLDPHRASRARLQLGSTLRLLGRYEESLDLLEAALERARREPDYPLADETRALLSLTYAKLGRTDEALGHALTALIPHLSHYRISMGRNAAELIDGTWRDAD